MGYSPTRKLDAAGVDVTSPAAFLAAIDFDNDPLISLREGRERAKTFQHYSLGFMMVIDEEQLIKIVNYLKLHLLARPTRDRRTILLIATATIDDWMSAIITGTSEGMDADVRILMCEVFNSLKTGGFQELFSSFTKRGLNDGTFTVSRD